MVKIRKVILKTLCAICIICASLAFVACKDASEYDKLIKEGYNIVVKYDANGGKLLSIDNTTLMDLYKSADLTAESDGSYHVKLLNPTDSRRKKQVVPTKASSSSLGWYRERNIVETEYEGTKYITDKDGNLIVEASDGNYTVAYTKTGGGYTKYSSETPTYSEPKYTYSGRWDFDNDEVVYNPQTDGELKVITLYAAWIDFFSFEFYAKNDSGEWEKYSTQEFSFSTIDNDATKADRNKIFMPYYEKDGNGVYTGGQLYASKYADGTTYNFPQVSGKNVVAAYTSADCSAESKITDPFTHGGTVNKENGTAANLVEKIYVETGIQEFYIDTVEQFSTLATSLSATYYLKADLTFTDSAKWPTNFTTGSFSGKLLSYTGSVITLTGISAKSGEQSTQFGIFGGISSSAEIKNINFDNATIDIAVNNISGQGSYGFLCGTLDENATVQNITISGKLRINGNTYLTSTESNANCTLNLVAVCEDSTKTSAIATDNITVELYGYLRSSEKYRYRLDKDSFSLDVNKNVSFSQLSATQSKNYEEVTDEYYTISFD